MQVTANPAPGSHFAGWTGEVSGSEPRQAVVMDAAKSLAAVFARSEPLRPGATKDVTPRTSRRFQLYGGRDGYDVLVPPDATELTVRFRSSSAAEADLYVRRGSEVRSEPGDAGETPCIHADFESTSRGASETIAIKRKSTPRMASDVYSSASPFLGDSGGFGERCGWRSGAAGSSRRGPRLSRACPPPGQTRTADPPADPPGNRCGPLQDRFQRDLASGPARRHGFMREPACKRFPSWPTVRAWRTTLTGAS